MALSFLRHLKPEALKSRKKIPASEPPLQTETSPKPLKDSSPAGDIISAQYAVGVDGQQRADEEEKESGICMDSSSELSRRESNEGQEDTDQEVASLSTIEDREDCLNVDVPVEVHTVFSEDPLEAGGSDIISASDATELSADDEIQSEIRSSYVDADVGESLEHPSESVMEEHPLESLQHHSEDRTDCSEDHVTDSINSLPPTSFHQVSEELDSQPEANSLTMPAFSSSTSQHGDDGAADDTESYVSTTSRQDSVVELGSVGKSQSPRRDNPEDISTSLDSQESSEISMNMSTEFSTVPPVLPPPAPPPPPPMGLLLPGDHTTSSTTDFQPTSASISKQEANDGGPKNELMRHIEAAALKMSNKREMFSKLDQGQGFPNAKASQLSESFTSDLKSVIASRQSRIGTSQLDGGEIPGKITIYQSRIGIPPEDTELSRVFLRRAAKAAPEDAPHCGLTDEKPAARQEVMGNGSTLPLTMTSGSRVSSAEDTTQFKVSNLEEKKFDASVADDVTEQSTSAAEDANACTGDAEEEIDMEDTEQNATEEMSWQNKSDDGEDNFPSTTMQNSVPNDTDLDTKFPAESSSSSTTPGREAEEKEFDQVVEDFDQYLEENTSANSWQDPSEIAPPPKDQNQISQRFSPKDSDVDSANGDIANSELTYTDCMSENSSSFSPNLGSFSEAESPVFEEMDEVVISRSAETVQEHSKLLAQPLESYNILPAIKEVPTHGVPKSRFSFSSIVASLRNTLGRRKQSKAEERRTSFADGSQMKFDDNWSIHDTLTHRGHTTADGNQNKSRSLRDVFVNYEVKSLSEGTDPDENSGKDFSVRNWKEVVERSKGDVTNISETDGLTGLLTKRSSSTPNLGSLGDTKYSSAKRSRAARKARSSKSKAEMEELSSNASVESPSRLTSSTLNSTLPSRHLHGMMQSFDSIYPGSPSLDGHYRKKAEPRKHSLPSKGTAAWLLSPVQRRKQRSQQLANR